MKKSRLILLIVSAVFVVVSVGYAITIYAMMWSNPSWDRAFRLMSCNFYLDPAPYPLRQAEAEIEEIKIVSAYEMGFGSDPNYEELLTVANTDDFIREFKTILFRYNDFPNVSGVISGLAILVTYKDDSLEVIGANTQLYYPQTGGSLFSKYEAKESEFLDFLSNYVEITER